MNIRILAALAATALLMFSAAHAADTAQYPTKPIRLIVPQQAGSSNDTLSRVVTNLLGEALGQQMVVDNRAGVGEIIGMEIGAAAVPDGYTLVSMATAQVISPYLQKKLAYDTLKDFAPVSLYGITYNVLVTHPSVPATNAKDFVALAKAKPGTLNMASPDPGSQSYLAGVMFSLVSGACAVTNTQAPEACLDF